MSDDPGSVTRLVLQLQAESPQAAAALWERFCARMLALARQRLGQGARRVADEEDVVVVAFERFLRGVRQGRFPRLADRDDLWAILFTLTTRQAAQQQRDPALAAVRVEQARSALLQDEGAAWRGFCSSVSAFQQKVAGWKQP